jgi:MSHA biogenesis protein MshK
VLISPGRKLAVIDGRTVTLGERVGDATVVAIAPAQVILQRGGSYQTLKLHPGIEKKP